MLNMPLSNREISRWRPTANPLMLVCVVDIADVRVFTEQY